MGISWVRSGAEITGELPTSLFCIATPPIDFLLDPDAASRWAIWAFFDSAVLPLFGF